MLLIDLFLIYIGISLWNGACQTLLWPCAMLLHHSFDKEANFFCYEGYITHMYHFSITKVYFGLHYMTQAYLNQVWTFLGPPGTGLRTTASKTPGIYYFTSKLQYKHTHNWMENDAMPQEIRGSSASSVDKEKDAL